MSSFIMALTFSISFDPKRRHNRAAEGRVTMPSVEARREYLRMILAINSNPASSSSFVNSLRYHLFLTAGPLRSPPSAALSVSFRPFPPHVRLRPSLPARPIRALLRLRSGSSRSLLLLRSILRRSSRPNLPERDAGGGSRDARDA